MQKILKIAARCTLIFPIVAFIETVIFTTTGQDILNHDPDRHLTLFFACIIAFIAMLFTHYVFED